MDWVQGLMVVDIVDACPSGVRRRRLIAVSCFTSSK